MYYINIGVVIVLVAYQLYLNFSEPEVSSLHAGQIEQIQTRLEGRNAFEFSVVGNVNNSVSIFQDQIIPVINASDAEFTVSAGNAVSGGAAENYRSVYNIFSYLNHPWLLTYGRNEDGELGRLRFYEQYGPHFYSFSAANAHFMFLDSTDNTAYNWQLDWLEHELSTSEAEHFFVFIGSPVHAPVHNTPIFQKDSYFQNEPVSEAMRSLFESYQVDIVFSSQLSVYYDQTIDGVRYITTGGGGGLIIDDENSFHHFLKVRVEADEVMAEVRHLDVLETSWYRTIESLWSSVYTFFYVSFGRFLIIVSLLVLIGLKLRETLFEDKDFYTQFTVDDTPWRAQPKRVLFFTNNFFPFISGVTISIERLLRGLTARGHEVKVVAPRYDQADSPREDTLRVRTLVAFGSHREFRLANLLQPGIRKLFHQFKPDIVHLHHPFWLGSIGLMLARQHRVPSVYTYHTRLEMYAHYVPLPGRIFRNVISHELIRRFCNRCDGVIVPTFSTEEYLRLIGVKSPLCVQPTGIDFDRFNRRDEARIADLKTRYEIAETDRVLVSVSRLGKEKNVAFLVDAMHQLQQQTEKSVRLLLVGDGDERPVLEEKIETLGLQASVTLVGAVSPDVIPDYYQMADVFVFASKSETQGMVILEAMAAGLPVVAVRSSGTDDVIEEGQTGFKTFDRIDHWVERVRYLIENDDVRSEFSERAVTFASHNDTDAFAENINRFYSELLARRAKESG
ncbi:glycosyltransferase [Saccharospirillum sp.]|uniref:glycosyltransferase n=1 Tax=Saccharospirillum sp. TaxID=2033801 RepID=UPI0034A049B4